MGLVDSKFELAGFVVVSWKDTMATPKSLIRSKGLEQAFLLCYNTLHRRRHGR